MSGDTFNGDLQIIDNYAIAVSPSLRAHKFFLRYRAFLPSFSFPSLFLPSPPSPPFLVTVSNFQSDSLGCTRVIDRGKWTLLSRPISARQTNSRKRGWERRKTREEHASVVLSIVIISVISEYENRGSIEREGNFRATGAIFFWLYDNRMDLGNNFQRSVSYPL